MFQENLGDELSGPKTRTWLALFGGAVAGAMLPKVYNYFVAKGMPPDQAKAMTDAVVKGALPPPPGAGEEAARLAELERRGQLRGGGLGVPAWVWPIGIGVVAIVFMGMRMPFGGGRRRRNPPRPRSWRRGPTARERRAVASAKNGGD